MSTASADQGSTTDDPKAPAIMRRFLAHWHTIECLVAVAAFALIAGLLLADVLGRELLGPLLLKLGYSGATGVFGSQKISVYALVVGSFAGIGIATATGSHLVPRVGFGWIPEEWAPAMNRVADVITGSVLTAVAWYGLQFVLSSRATGLTAPVLGFAVWPIQLAIPLGFLSAAFRYFFYAIWPALRPEAPEFQE